MKEITYNQAQWIAQNNEYVNEVVNSFKRICADVLSNTQIQLTRFDIIDKALEINEFIQNDDVNATVVKKIENWVENTANFIESDDYKKTKAALCEISVAYSKYMKDNNRD